MPCRGLLLNQLIDMLQYYILTDANSLYIVYVRIIKEDQQFIKS